jgi:hypothetical protein
MAISLKKKNFAKSTLDGGISDSATSLTLQTGDGSKFPATGNFRAVLWAANYDDPANDPNREIVEATLSAGDTFTITRAKEGTTANAWSSGDNFALTLTKGVLDEIETEINGHTHDDRYYTETELDAGQLDNRYYTETEVDTFRGHNGESVLSANFDITAANGTYMDTGLSITLPAAGTYLIFARVRCYITFTAGSTGKIVYKLYNSTDAADIANSKTLGVFGVNVSTASITTATLIMPVTVDGTDTIKLYAMRDGATTWTVSQISSGQSDGLGETNLGYTRIK